MDGRAKTSAQNGLKGGRPLSSATLHAQLLRDELAAAVHAEFELIYRPQIEKAKGGDTQAFTALMDRAAVKPIAQSEVTRKLEYKLDDQETEKLAEDLTRLQKENTRSARV